MNRESLSGLPSFSKLMAADNGQISEQCSSGSTVIQCTQLMKELKGNVA